MNDTNLPAWTAKYANGERMSNAQAYAEYAAYFCVDGTADSEPGIEERLAPASPLLRPYASRTGTKTTLANMRKMGWSILVSAAGVLRTEHFQRWVWYHLCPITIDTEIPRETGATARYLQNWIDCQ